MTFVIAIDGPAASGKGTIARALAAEFGFVHLDTGLLYRAVGALVAEGADPVEAAKALDRSTLQRRDLRSEGAGQAASKVAAMPEVRAELLAFQRRIAKSKPGAVLDGRDIGTVVCPDADIKLFVIASDEVRAQRRWQEEGGPDSGKTLDSVLEDLKVRDQRDQERASSPLRAAEDAVTLDTSKLSVSEAAEAAIDAVRKTRASHR